MTENRLKIISVEVEKSNSSFQNTRNDQLRGWQAKFERLWLTDPEQFNPLRNCLERERLERTWNLINQHIDLPNKKIIDLGCAAGVFTRRLRDAGAQVEGIDIAENALKKFQEKDAKAILLKRAAMPITDLPDNAYQLVVCTELIADIPKEDYRLFFAELARIIHPEGRLVCSTAIDIDSVGGVERLIELAQTEFDIIEDVPSYHALFLRLKRLCNIPSRYTKAWENPLLKRQEIAGLSGLKRVWYQLNTSPVLAWMWYACNFVTGPSHKFLNQNHTLLLFLEKISRFLWHKEGISHYLFIAKRRSLPEFDPKDIPQSRPRRKEVWD